MRRGDPELRPHIDLYLLTGESIAADGDDPDLRNRTFPGSTTRPDLYARCSPGRFRNRYGRHRFSMRCRPCRCPVGQFHALPVARGASIFNSAVAGRWASSTVATSSWRRHRRRQTFVHAGSLRQHQSAMDKAAHTWRSNHTYFVTNGTSTANKIVVQALVRPGDIVLIDRNCHKSHHYGLVLAGRTRCTWTPIRCRSTPEGGAAAHHQTDAVRPEAAGAAASRCGCLLTNCTFDGVVYNPGGDEGCWQSPDICFLGRSLVRIRHRRTMARQSTAAISAERLGGPAGFARNTPRSTGSGESRCPVSTVPNGGPSFCIRTRTGEGPGVLDAFDPQIAVGAASGVDGARARSGTSKR